MLLRCVAWSAPPEKDSPRDQVENFQEESSVKLEKALDGVEENLDAQVLAGPMLYNLCALISLLHQPLNCCVCLVANKCSLNYIGCLLSWCWQCFSCGGGHALQLQALPSKFFPLQVADSLREVVGEHNFNDKQQEVFKYLVSQMRQLASVTFLPCIIRLLLPPTCMLCYQTLSCNDVSTVLHASVHVTAILLLQARHCKEADRQACRAWQSWLGLWFSPSQNRLAPIIAIMLRAYN